MSRPMARRADSRSAVTGVPYIESRTASESTLVGERIQEAERDRALRLAHRAVAMREHVAVGEIRAVLDAPHERVGRLELEGRGGFLQLLRRPGRDARRVVVVLEAW